MGRETQGYNNVNPPPFNPVSLDGHSENPQYPNHLPPNYGTVPPSYGSAPPNYNNNFTASPPYAPAPPSYGSQPNQYNQVDKEEGEKFQTTGYRDIFFSIFYVIHLLAFFGILVAGIIKYSSVTSDADMTFFITPSELSFIIKFLGICAACAAFAVVLSIIYLAMIKRFPKAMIISTLIMSIIFWLVLAAYLLIVGALWAGVILLVIAVFNGICFWMWRARIPFAALMLSTVCEVIKSFPATAVTGYLSLILQFIVVFIWCIAVITIQAFGRTAFTILFIFLLFSLYWSAQVIKNVVHVTVSGVFASWYFLRGNGGIPSNPTLGALRRACTTSFGSICFGSLLVAALQTFRALIQMSRNGQSQIWAAIVDCILSCVENLLRYFNKYAFTQVAIYGKTYIRAAKDTWELVKTHGVQAIINDDLISGILTMGSLGAAIICAILGGILGYAILPNNEWTSAAVAGFIIGFSLVILALEVVESGVATIFVSFAMDKAALQRADPVLYESFKTRYGLY